MLAPLSLIQLANHFKGAQVLSRPARRCAPAGALPDLRDIKGQESAKRALEIAAAGGHNLLMNGPPGAGKSMLAARLPSILPPLTPRELLEVSLIHSVAGQLAGGALTDRRPFRAPHHSASMAALVGGGIHARPGEISLAHHGVLFLDELPEFQPQVLDSLRQPLETGEVAIARANHRITLSGALSARRGDKSMPLRPCAGSWLLLAAGNPPRAASRNIRRACPVRCSTGSISMIEVPAVNAADLMLPPAAEGSAEVAARVAAARRYSGRSAMPSSGLPHVFSNAAAPGHVIEDMARLDTAGMVLLREASERLNLSARGFHRILKLARTIADLDGAATVGRPHLAEACHIASALRRSCARPRTVAAASMRSLIATHHFLPKASQFREIFYFSGEFWEFFSSILPCRSVVFFLFYSCHFALHHFMERCMSKFPRSVAISVWRAWSVRRAARLYSRFFGFSGSLTAADTDKDGTIDLTEAKAAASAEFDKLDKDKDGTLDLKEVAHHVSKANFSAANPDNDKTLTKDEYLALWPSCSRRPIRKAMGPSNSKELHSKAGIALDRAIR